jgi:hypothetical protein
MAKKYEHDYLRDVLNALREGSMECAEEERWLVGTCAARAWAYAQGIEDKNERLRIFASRVICNFGPDAEPAHRGKIEHALKNDSCARVRYNLALAYLVTHKHLNQDICDVCLQMWSDPNFQEEVEATTWPRYLYSYWCPPPFWTRPDFSGFNSLVYADYVRLYRHGHV